MIVKDRLEGGMPVWSRKDGDGRTWLVVVTVTVVVVVGVLVGSGGVGSCSRIRYMLVVKCWYVC